MAAYLNRIATAVPDHDVHDAFVAFADTLLTDRRSQVLFRRMAERSQIEHRFSTVEPRPLSSNAALDTDGFYCRGGFPSTAKRMQRYADEAPGLALGAARGLNLTDEERGAVTHVIVTTCTGFTAPGLDLQLVEGLGLKPSVERTVVGFMGCYAAINALKMARHVVRSEPESKVLVVSLELCTLHLQETSDLEQVLSFLVFGDGCAAALISSEADGLELESFHAEMVPAAADQITWNIGDMGFDMYLSGQVPASLRHALDEGQDRILRDAPIEDFDLWAIHPGGRTVLDAVEAAFSLPPKALGASREVLRRFGNMSSATVLFVLKTLLDEPSEKGARGCAMAFGPGLTAETMLFEQGVTMLPDFSHRAQLSELMDDPAVDYETFRACLVDLAKVNRATFAYRPTIAFLNRLHDAGLWPKDRPAVILDVGSGYGDMLRLVGRWARDRSLDVRLQGLDRNPWAARSAERAYGSESIQWLSEDLFDHHGGADIILSSLFTHHLDDISLTRFLEWQEANARIGWFINDLLRHPFSYYGFSLLSRLMLWHRLVVHDGPVSIRRAFRPEDWTVLLARAGVREARIEPWFPFRLCVSRVRHALN